MPAPVPISSLCVLAGGDDLVHKRVDGRAAAVDDALSADLDHRRVRQDPEVRRRLRRRQKLRVGQRSLHEERLELRRRVGHWVSFVVSFVWFDSSSLIGGTGRSPGGLRRCRATLVCLTMRVNRKNDNIL